MKPKNQKGVFCTKISVFFKRAFTAYNVLLTLFHAVSRCFTGSSRLFHARFFLTVSWLLISCFKQQTATMHSHDYELSWKVRSALTQLRHQHTSTPIGDKKSFLLTDGYDPCILKSRAQPDPKCSCNLIGKRTTGHVMQWSVKTSQILARLAGSGQHATHYAETLAPLPAEHGANGRGQHCSARKGPLENRFRMFLTLINRHPTLACLSKANQPPAFFLPGLASLLKGVWSLEAWVGMAGRRLLTNIG